MAATCVRDGSICEDCVGKRVKWPAVVHRCYHDSMFGKPALATGLTLHRAIGTFANSVDRYLTLTSFAKRLLERDGFPRRGSWSSQIPCPTPGEPTTRSTSHPRYLFFAGRLLDIKGVRTLLDAWRRADTGDMRLVLAGDGELRPLVEAVAASDPTVDFRGWVEEAQVTDLMAGAAATLVPSQWYEGLPLVILRSLSVGTPVLVSDLENISQSCLGPSRPCVHHGRRRCPGASDDATCRATRRSWRHAGTRLAPPTSIATAQRWTCSALSTCTDPFSTADDQAIVPIVSG